MGVYWKKYYKKLQPAERPECLFKKKLIKMKQPPRATVLKAPNEDELKAQKLFSDQIDYKSGIYYDEYNNNINLYFNNNYNIFLQQKFMMHNNDLYFINNNNNNINNNNNNTAPINNNIIIASYNECSKQNVYASNFFKER